MEAKARPMRNPVAEPTATYCGYVLSKKSYVQHNSIPTISSPTVIQVNDSCHPPPRYYTVCILILNTNGLYILERSDVG